MTKKVLVHGFPKPGAVETDIIDESPSFHAFEDFRGIMVLIPQPAGPYWKPAFIKRPSQMTHISRKPPILPSAESYGHNMRATNRLLQRELGSRVVRLGLNLGQWYALRTLWESDEITQIELAQKSGIAGPAMVAAVRGLLTMGLVRRQRPPGDKRKYVISLTDKGWALQEAAIAASIEVNQLALQGIPPEDVATCLRVLRAAHDNLLPLAQDDNPASADVDRLISDPLR